MEDTKPSVNISKILIIFILVVSLIANAVLGFISLQARNTITKLEASQASINEDNVLSYGDSGNIPGEQEYDGTGGTTTVVQSEEYYESMTCSATYQRNTQGKYERVPEQRIPVKDGNEQASGVFISDADPLRINVDNIKELIGAEVRTFMGCFNTQFPQNIIVFSYFENDDTTGVPQRAVYKSGQNEVVGKFTTRDAYLTSCDYPIGFTNQNNFYFQCRTQTTSQKTYMETFKADILDNQVTKIADVTGDKFIDWDQFGY